MWVVRKALGEAPASHYQRTLPLLVLAAPLPLQPSWFLQLGAGTGDQQVQVFGCPLATHRETHGLQAHLTWLLQAFGD